MDGQKRPTNKQWSKIEAAIKILVAKKDIKSLIRYESDKTTPPRVDAEAIRFNGRREEGAETFYFGRDKDEEFCKTNQKAYDLQVVASLVIATHYAPNCIFPRSDGDPEEWEAGTKLAESITGEEFKGYVKHY